MSAADPDPIEELEDIIEDNLADDPHFYDDPDLPRPLGAQWIGPTPDPYRNDLESAIESVVHLQNLVAEIQAINEHRSHCSGCGIARFHAGGSET